MGRLLSASFAILPLVFVLVSTHNPIEMKIISDLLATESKFVSNVYNVLDLWTASENAPVSNRKREKRLTLL